ncbi:MAG TPA: polymer-forming cytoskeletal protein, partial [Candidatus Andersenbacteria bacterium]|nr:polymer-forming cytoskeletal protein [Candidatus Andersenbacteria bacterium]
DVYIGGEHVTISGTIHGNLFVAGNSITVTNGGTVMGNITARGSAPVIEPGATVTGKVKTIGPNETEGRSTRAFELGAFIASVVSTAVFALALLFGAPVLVAKNKEAFMGTPLVSGFIGLLWLLACIPATLLLFASGIGIYLGLFIISVTLPLSFLAFGILVSVTGSVVYRLVTKKEGIAWQNTIIGAVIVALLALLGFIGFILVSVALLVALGALLTTLWTIIQGK